MSTTSTKQGASNMCSVRNVKLVNVKTELGKVAARDNWLISHLVYRWIKSNGKEFACTRAELARYMMCTVQHVTVLLRKYSRLFLRRYVHTGKGENRRTHLHIDINLVELCIMFGERIYDSVSRSLADLLREKLDPIFAVLARTFSSSKKTQEVDLNTNNLGDVSVSDSASPYTMSISPEGEVVDMENEIPTKEKKDEIRAFAPALCDERASAISSGGVTPPRPAILKHNKPYSHVLTALKDRGEDPNTPLNTLDRLKQMVKGRIPTDNTPIQSQTDDVHPLRRLLNKKLGYS